MTIISRIFVALVALSVTPIFTVAFAQSPESSRGLEELIVTAERREENLQVVPLAVSAFNSDQLRDFQIDEARDLQLYVPSLNMFNNVTSPTNLSPSLRGGLQQDASLVTAESPFGIYVDGVYVGRLNGNNVRLSDIERIEVLRGPQGTLYGRNTGYGAIKFISRTPGEDLWFDATVGAGNYDQLLFSASVGGPLGDSWAGSFSAQYDEKEGEYRNVAQNQDVDNQENMAVRGKLRFMGLDKFDAVLSVSYSDAENDSGNLVKGTTPGVAGRFTTDDLVFPNGEWNTNTLWSTTQTPPSSSFQPAPLVDKPTGDTEQTIVGLTLSYDITDNLTVKSITGYVGLDDYFHTDFSGNTADPTEAFGALGAADIDADQWSQEFQLLGEAFNDNLSYIVGLFYLNEEADQQFGWNLPNLAGIPLPGGVPLSQSLIETEVDSIAVFGEATYSLANWRFTAGLRWTEDDKEFDINYQNPPGSGPQPCLPPNVNCSFENDYDEWTPRLVVDYTLADAGVIDSMMFYAQYAEGFKSGGYSAIALFSTAPVGAYFPETNKTYEGGIKAEWFSNTLRTNLAYFFSEIDDIQQNSTANVPAGGFEFPVENVGDAEIQGLEFEITWAPLQGVNIFANGTAFGDAKYTRLEPGSAGANAEAAFGSATPPQVPDYAFNVGFDYTYDFRGNFLGLGAVTLGSDYYETDDYYTAATNEFYNSGWDIWNAFISAQLFENWELRFEGKNLADDFIVVSGSRALGGFVSLPPREFLFTVNYRL
jgi:iron complex outermembrane receptor protein